MNAPDRLDSVRDRDAGQPGARRRVALERDSKVANAATFTLLREDHTVGHLLRMELLRDPGVRFAGYKHPHPLENDIVVKVQAAPGSTPNGVVEAALRRLETEFTVMQTAFRGQVEGLRRREAEIGSGGAV